jgi:diguanylate cyclase (GGDEF)-like protein
VSPPSWLWVAAFFAYVLAATLGLAFAFPGTNATPFWPPTALAFALLYRYGLRMWPVVLAAAFTINTLFMLRAGVAPLPSVAASLGVGIGNTLEAWLGIYVLRRVAGDQFPFDGLRGLTGFFLAAALAPAVCATIGVTCSRLASMSGAASYSQNWFTWWVGDTSSALTMAPVLMLLLQARWRVPTPARMLESTVLTLTLVFGSMAAFGIGQKYGDYRYPLAFFLLPMILWAVLRFQNAGAVGAVFLISKIAVLSSIVGVGPFARSDVNESLLLLQVFVIVLAGTSLSLGTVLTERGRLIASLATSNAELNALAFNDPLTGLPNRRALLERLQQVERTARRHSKRAALLFLDLDRFKRINDSLGHQVGDELLKTVARRLRHALRDEDTVCRLGGDEFVVLLGEIDAATDPAVVARKLIETLQEPMKLAEYDLGVSTSIGIALVPDDGTDAKALIRYADMAMYRAKERGRSNFQFYKEEMNLAAVARLEREHELHKALQDKQFCVYYEPIVDVRTAVIIGVEAQLRWRHPQRGLLMPQEFVPLAEETGLIVELGSWALQQACSEIGQLLDDGCKNLSLSIDMSLRQLHDRNLAELIAHSLGRTRIEALWLNLEITDRLLREDVLADLKFLNPLGRTAVALTVDDFGSIDSTMRLLGSLPIGVVKIDRKLVARLFDDPAARDIALAAIRTTRKFGVEVVGEHVATQEQRDFLAINGCKYAQGFWFHRPQPIAELATLLPRTDAALAAS